MKKYVINVFGDDDEVKVQVDGDRGELALMLSESMDEYSELASIVLAACIGYLSNDAADASHFKSILDKAVKDNINLN